MDACLESIWDYFSDLLHPQQACVGWIATRRKSPNFGPMIYRHGDRYPSKTFPNDVNRAYFEKRGWSQLTEKGMAQTYDLGKFLRRRYAGFLSQEYLRDEIYVRSTDKDRSLQSALCTVAGLYEYNLFKDPCPGLLLPTFIPVPVHTVPVDEDILLEMETHCPLYENHFHNYTLPEYKKINKQHRVLMDYLKFHSGLPKVEIAQVSQIYGALFRGLEQGFPLPKWAQKMWDFKQQKTVFDLIVELKTLHNILKFNSTENAKLTSGYLLGDILQRMLHVSESHGEKPKKMMMYSAHDNTLISLKYSLKIPTDVIIPYAACLMIELYEHKDHSGSEYLVEFLYRNETFSDEIHRLKIPGCHLVDGTKFSGLCRLRNLVNILRYSTLYPASRRNKVCGIGGEK